MNRTKPMSFTLGPHDSEFIEDMVSNGRFGNKTEVVRAGLRLLEDYENSQKLNRLRAEIARGEMDFQVGKTTSFDSAEELIADILKRK